MADYTTIDDPSAHFQVATWTGNGGSDRAIVNDGNSAMQPDWVWYKSRSHATSHISYDSSRGDGPYLKPSDAGDEGTDAQMFESFDSDGFSLNGDTDGNGSGRTYVAWQWKCNGGTTSSNTDGDINSTVQVNQDAGFSIVTYTGNGSTSDQTIGHGLGVRANAVIVKNRDAAVNWVVWSEGVDANHSLELNTTDGISDSTQGRVLSNAGSRGTSTIFSIRSGNGSVVQTNTSGEDYVAYCFAEKQGYSKFGKYKGNSSTNGAFVYLGFKPRFVMIKSMSAGAGWWMHDTKRSPHNVMDDYLRAESASQQGTSATVNIDFLSNGFKLRYGNNTNFSNHTYTYMAFAEQPFVTSTGIPATAR